MNLTSVRRLLQPGCSVHVSKKPVSSMLLSKMNFRTPSWLELEMGAGGGEVELQYVQIT